MPTNMTQQTIEPVHIRADQPPTPAKPASTEPIVPAADKQAKPAHAVPAAASPATAQKPASAKIKQPPKTSNNSVVVAIIATVVIVLGLAGLAVFAYIKTQK